MQRCSVETLAPCVSAVWRAHLRGRQQRRELLEHAVQAMLCVRLRSAWAGWQAWLAERRAAAGHLQAAVRAWQRSLLLKAFRWEGQHGREGVGK